MRRHCREEEAHCSSVSRTCFQSEERAYLGLMHMYSWPFKEARCRNAYLAASHNVFYCPCRPFCNILWKFILKEISNPND